MLGDDKWNGPISINALHVDTYGHVKVRFAEGFSMSKTQDAYSGGMYVSLTCSQCQMVATTLNRADDFCPLTISDVWKTWHEMYNPGHLVARFIHYAA